MLFVESRAHRARIAAAAALFLTRSAFAAGFNGSNNVALYWGQNSYGQGTGSLAQQSLATYCANSDIDIIPMAFLVQVTTGPGGQPVINFANQGNNCTLFPGTGLLDCPQIGEDIQKCQQTYGKTILLSIGGATYTEGGFASEDAAIAAAELIWGTFGPPSSSANSTNVTSSANSSLSGTITGATSVAPTDGTTSTDSTGTVSNLAITTTTGTALATARVTSSATDIVSENATTAASSSHNSTADASSMLTSFETTFMTIVEVQTATSDSTASSITSTKILVTSSDTLTTAAATSKTSAALERRATSAPLRPFHDAVIDGFDLDLETTTQNFPAFAKRLRQLMAASPSRPYYLTAAPQCPYPDLADNGMLNGGIPFDAVFVQFYNNYCGLQSFNTSNFNFNTWDGWAKNGSANPDVKVFLGVPAGQTAAGSGYTPPSGLKPIIDYCKGFKSFGGIMAWDASQAVANDGFLEGVKSALGGDTTSTTKRESVVRRTLRSARKWTA